MPESQPYQETGSVLPPRLAAPVQQSRPPSHPQSEEGEVVKIQVATAAARGLLSASQRRVHPGTSKSMCEGQRQGKVICAMNRNKFHTGRAHSVRQRERLSRAKPCGAL